MTISLGVKIDLARQPENDDERFAVRELKRALGRLGFYAPDPHMGMTDDIDVGLKDAVYAFQRKATIYFDDVAIGPGTTTERILSRDLAALPSDAKYIWRTVGDNKVRGEHAARSGQTYSWSNPPDGENPGEDYNCRCWAEPINPSRHPWNEWARERQELRAKLAAPKGLNAGPETQQFPTDAIEKVYPLETILLGGKSTKLIFNITEKLLRNPQWSFGGHKSGIQWANRMEKRGWTAEKISETIRKGKKFKAPNDVNKGNKAIRYEYKGNFVVRDEKKKEIIQLGAEHFDRRIK